ncbi:hypothetical protein [Paenibacillus radicis (ex Xue et al. 2023)]|uniref:Uncharacterized protein n=1 Tax=Paenibacillus radicis (ex Xue et al. 2023) TaxID=2972489 RepID=A0ABT1YBC7_9BACL|nr:hypothetical protein [Paenibacillus radicis (ex Xue et al. 2023)]MCR8630482.1 hypothetical protein [Paenibacillus radicis (ex Xue et al. 2023)]
MNLLKTKFSALVVCSALMLTSAAGVAAAADSTTQTPTTIHVTPPPLIFWSVGQTMVNGTYVPGNYLIGKDSKVAFIPGGVGLVVVDKSIALPVGAYYVK